MLRVTYKIAEAVKLGNPYGRDCESDHAYLRHLREVPLMFSAAEGELDIDEEAELVGIGSFPTTRKEAQ